MLTFSLLPAGLLSVMKLKLFFCFNPAVCNPGTLLSAVCAKDSVSMYIFTNLICTFVSVRAP